MWSLVRPFVDEARVLLDPARVAVPPEARGEDDRARFLRARRRLAAVNVVTGLVVPAVVTLLVLVALLGRGYGLGAKVAIVIGSPVAYVVVMLAGMKVTNALLGVRAVRRWLAG